MPGQERTIETPVTTDSKLDMTDEKGLSDLNKAFDDSFGPRDGAPLQPEPQAKPEPAKTRQDAPGSREKAAPGHHAPVEVKRAPAAPQEADGPLNLLGEPTYRAKPRERKSIDFDEEIPSKSPEEKKTSAFPGRDGKSGRFTKPQAAPVETEETEEETETKPEEDEDDPEVDAVVAKPNAHPNVKEGIQRLKTIAKARRAQIKALASEADQLKTEVETLKKSGISPEIQKELDRLRATSQRFDLLNDPQFKTRYEDPIETSGDRLLKFCVDLSEDHPDIKKWAEETKKFGFKNLSPDYWDKEIIPKIASITNQQRVAQLAADLHAKIDERNRMVTEFTATPDKIQEYRNQQALEYYTNYQREAQDESDKLVSQIGEWAQIKDLSKAKTDEERALFEEHNKRTEGYKTLFEKTMGDVMHGGARKHVRVVAQAIYGMELDRQLQELRADYEALEAEHEALRTQYNRVTRARSVPGRTGGGVDVKPSQGISTKDARTAFKEYFGTQGS
jgi:archaellum component FlaC